jgi:hypothetical protein
MAVVQPTPSEPLSEPPLKRFEQLSRVLDTQIKAPGIPFRIGLDGILGLIPGVGDVVTGGMGAYAFLVARKHKLPWHIHARILKNLLVDTLVGAIPLVGDLFDFAFHAHRKNYDLLSRAIAKRSAP